jgi:hypothetical protein
MPSVDYKVVKFAIPVVEYENLKISKPFLPSTSTMLLKAKTFHGHSFFLHQLVLVTAGITSVPPPAFSLVSHLNPRYIFEFLHYASTTIDYFQTGIIVHARDPHALANVEDWEPVFIDIEGQKFSTWRGVAPKGYVVVGHFFVTGIEKPTREQTVGIKAIRKDIIADLPVNHLIWERRLPFAHVKLLDREAAPKLYVSTGAFVSQDGDYSDVQIGLLIHGAAAESDDTGE